MQYHEQYVLLSPYRADFPARYSDALMNIPLTTAWIETLYKVVFVPYLFLKSSSVNTFWQQSGSDLGIKRTPADTKKGTCTFFAYRDKHGFLNTSEYLICLLLRQFAFACLYSFPNHYKSIS